ncbi:MAG TPA: hypothetical protein VMT47_02730 [Polyangia bacterium]|nr:hypothetical protein [Polyangia bacterium]
MKRKITCLFSMFMIAGSTLAARSVRANTTVSILNLRDGLLVADFEDATDDNCIITQTDIRFSQSVTQIAGPPIVGPPTTLVTVVYANSCTGDFIEFDGGTTTQTFQIAQDLSSATLSGTAPAFDQDGNGTSVSFNISWAANAPLQSVDQKTVVTRTSGGLTVDRFKDEFRTADVSGTVSAVIPQLGPPALDLSRFPEGGSLGQNVLGTRTITFNSP